MIEMLIDFHTHMFPEAIAKRALGGIIERTKEIYDIDQDTSFDGTLAGLRASMDVTGVGLSVVLPIATKPGQHVTINRYAEEARGDGVVSFASVHPYDEAPDEILKDIARRGFIGIKLHPDYQNVFADDPRFISVVKKAQELGLYVVIHSGEDLGMRPPFHCTAAQLKTLVSHTDETLLIAAHMGGFNIWDDILNGFTGTRMYFDTAVVSRYIDRETYRRIIDRHGADRILFGSDAPWEDPRDTYAFLTDAGLSSEEIELIKHKNAEKILGDAVDRYKRAET